MIPTGWEGLAFFIASLLVFVITQRWLHFELQAVLLILTRSGKLTLGLFSLLFFPGVFLHEASHLISAKILRVRTGRFSLIPSVQPDGTLRLGYVETVQVDPLRDAIIGTAPLITGAVVMTWLGVSKLGLLPLLETFRQSDWLAFSSHLRSLPAQPDFWLWFYLAFATSSTMLPSASDRRSWLAVVLIVAGLVGGVMIAGGGPWMATALGPSLNRLLLALAFVFTLSMGLHFLLALPTWIMRQLLSRITGLQVT